MAMAVYSVGDEVYYPQFNMRSDRKLKIIDRRMIYYSKSQKLFTRYLFDETLLEYLAQDMLENVKNEYDNVVVIQGKEGSGKSQLAYQLCKCLDPEFDMEESYVYNYQEFVEAIRKADEHSRGKIFWMDEGSLVASNREAMTEGNKRFVQVLETMRSRGWTLIMTIPSIDRLDLYIREYRVRYLLTALEMKWDGDTKKKRGYYELAFKRPQNQASFYTVAYGKYGKMDPEEQKTYNALKGASQKRLMAKISGEKEDGKKRKKTRLTNAQDKLSNLMLILREQGKSVEEIAEIVDMTPQTVRSRLSDARRCRKEKEQKESEQDGKSKA